MNHRAPSPPGHWLLGHIPQFQSDVLGGITEAVRTCGDIVRFRLGPQTVHLLNRPEYAGWVLQRQHRQYDKQSRSSRAIRRVTGESLLTADGDAWQRCRRLLQPAFHHRSIAGFGDIMTKAADSWHATVKPGEAFDFAAAMHRLTFTIAGQCLFQTDTAADSTAMHEALNVILPETFARLGRIWNWPDWIPTPRNRLFSAALSRLDAIVGRIIAGHLRDAALGNEHHDILGMLLKVRDDDTGQGLSHLQLRNETITFLIAGHETTANALTWAFHLLARHPDAVATIQAELDSVLGRRLPTTADLPRLVHTRMAIREAMRLYPPIWIIERRARQPDCIAGIRIPAGSSVIICPWTLHRHPEFWPDPESFQPARFAAGTPDAWIPFGAGPRFCIGSEFAMMEAVMVTAMILTRFRPVPASVAPVVPWPGITLRARDGLPLRLVPRHQIDH